MSGQIYTASFQDVAAVAVQDLFEILAPSDAVLELLGLTFGQTDDVGDAAEEILLTTLRMVSGAPTSGSGGTTPTPRPHHLGGAASGVVCEANNDTQLTGGTNVVLIPILVNVRIPETQIQIPEGRYFFSPGTRLLWELEDTPADPLTISGSATWKELGG